MTVALRIPACAGPFFGEENPINVLWLSANQFGFALLPEALAVKGMNVINIVTLASSAKTRMYDGVPSERWKEFGIPVTYVDDVNAESEALAALRPDLIVMCGWRQVLDASLLALPKQGVVGFHPTPLPIGRGPAPIINTLLSGVTESGVTLFHVDGGLDTGDLIGQVPFSIGPNDHASDVYARVIEAGKVLVRTYFPLIASGHAPRTKQNETRATYFQKVSRQDNALDPQNDTLESMHRKIRAFSHPYEGAFIVGQGKRLVLWRADLRHDGAP